MTERSHLAAMLHWSVETEIRIVHMVAAGLAVAVPAAVGTASGHLMLGLAGALGGMVTTGPFPTGPLRERLADLVPRLASGLVAAIVAVLIASLDPLVDTGAMIAAVALAAAAGDYSRFMAAATTRFILMLIIMVSLFKAVQASPGQEAALFAFMLFGMGFAGVLALIFGWLAQHLRKTGTTVTSEPVQAVRPEPTAAQKRTRLRRVLSQPAGWQYPIRLVAVLVVATACEALWPGHHMHWVAVTAALLLQRQAEGSTVMISQRVLGSLIGVACASLFLVYQPSTGFIIAALGVIGALRPWLRVRNYLAYAVAMTPLVMLILDGDGGLTAAMLLDRLMATVIGSAAVIAADVTVLRWLLPRPA